MDRRERDSAGRPRNARPRDGLGRPLARGMAGVPRAPEGLVRTPADTVDEAQRLFDAGLPFHAHEVLEDAWKSAPEAERPLWQGLAQLAVGFTHLRRGNRVGAGSLLVRGRDRIRPYAADPPHGLDIAGLLAWVEAVRGALEDALMSDADLPGPRLRR
ncbi:DUF309 domain-containing protein [Rhodococcus sp. NPDC058532]|uniref:DUF309 domain-containing protein n=1 Tax=Rhodococcus sp. NPDC058532 TaxID=3346540 RepID=UPI00364AA779